RRPELRTRGVTVRGHAAHHEHLGGKRERDVDEIFRSLAVERGDRLLDLERVAAGASEWAIHGGDHGDYRTAVARADLDHLARKIDLLLERGEKSAAAALDVDYETGEILRQLLAHDARRDERDGFDGRRR